MTYEEIYRNAKKVIGEENIDDYRPATFEVIETTRGRFHYLPDLHAPDTVPYFGRFCVPDTIMIWLKNGDCLWYRDNTEWRNKRNAKTD